MFDASLYTLVIHVLCAASAVKPRRGIRCRLFGCLCCVPETEVRPVQPIPSTKATVGFQTQRALGTPPPFKQAQRTLGTPSPFKQPQSAPDAPSPFRAPRENAYPLRPSDRAANAQLIPALPAAEDELVIMTSPLLTALNPMERCTLGCEWLKGGQTPGKASPEVEVEVERSNGSSVPSPPTPASHR